MLQEEKLTVTAKNDGVKIILVVEDDHDTQGFFSEALSMLTPYHIQIVRNATEALDRVKQIKPNLFLLDYHLPKMNGIELFDCLHAIPELENIPAVIISATTTEHMKREIEGRKLKYIEKPFDLDVFLGTIEQEIAIGG